MSSLGGERSSVQNPIINYVSESSTEYSTADDKKIFLNLNWEYVKPKEALRWRGGNTGFIFKEIFIAQMQKLNPNFMDPLLAEYIMKKLKEISSNIEGNFIVWEYLKGLRSVFVPNEKRERNVKFFDTENIDNNTFHVTDEFEFTNGTKTIRPDIVFLINGIPVILVETKAAHKIEGISEALEQVKRYHRECPELLAILQIYTLTHLLKYYYSTTWTLSEKYLFNWKEEEAVGNFEQLVKTFFDRKRVIKLLTDFILFTRQDDELKKVVLRPHQMRAIHKIIERAENSEKQRGLIWHTQGSGKTYTMIVAAQKIIENPQFENPTVIMLVDRTELESQLFANLSAVGIEAVEVAQSKDNLKELLSSDRIGLIVTTIHKFEGMPEHINTRKNIFVLVDEAHRTTGGKLGNYLMGALPNATFIGFTGTPIDKTSQGNSTFITFGQDDPPKGYLDKYSIIESIEDGTTVPLHYTLAPSEMRVEKEILEKEFLNLKEAEGVSDVEALNKVLEKAVTLKNMLKNKERIQHVAKYVAEHYRGNVEPMGYKAFLVAVDREACALYKEELDKHLPPEYSKVVYSRSNNNDNLELAKYYLSEEEEKRIRKDFRNPNKPPKILIVTEKLLTGFDAPILYCMYLDKPMRDHVLLQAIARVNRPYEDEEKKKTSGLIIDFIGIFDNLEKALAFDSADIKDIVRDINVLKDQFVKKMEEAKGQYLTIITGKTSDKAVEAVLEHFMDDEKRNGYYKFFKELSAIYEILSPDKFLRPYINDYDTLARMYRILKEYYESKTVIDKEFTKKTAQLFQEHTRNSNIEFTLDVCEIDENYLRKLEESKATDTEKIFNIINSIKKTLESGNQTSSYLFSIAEKAEKIVEMYKRRQKNAQETLEELKQIIEEMTTADREQSEKGMSDVGYTIYWILKDEKFENADAIAIQMEEILKKYPYWQKNQSHERSVREEFYGVLLQSDAIDKVKDIIDKILQTLKR